MNFSDLNLRDVGVTIQLAGAVYTDGKDGFILLPFPGESFEEYHLDQTVRVLDLTVDEWNEFLRQTDLVEVEALVKGDDGKIGKALLRKSSRNISQNVSWAVYRRDHYRCRYCGTNDVPLTVDHLVLWEEGGPSIETNLVAACKQCNNRRGNQPYHLWIRSGYYKKVSAGIPPMIQDQNERLINTLDAIPRSPRKGKRGR